MDTDRVDTTLSEAGQAVVPAAIQTIRQKLPFTIDLSPAERHHLPQDGRQEPGLRRQSVGGGNAASGHPAACLRRRDHGLRRGAVRGPPPIALALTHAIWGIIPYNGMG